MPSQLWPFFFELNPIQRKPYRERTVFVTMHESGESTWLDHTGRLTRRGGIGTIELNPHQPARHFRGARELTPAEEEAERREFTIRVEIPEEEFVPVRALIERVGVPWRSGWDNETSLTLHH